MIFLRKIVSLLLYSVSFVWIIYTGDMYLDYLGKWKDMQIETGVMVMQFVLFAAKNIITGFVMWWAYKLWVWD